MGKLSIADRFDIRDQFNRYTEARDTGDVDGVAGCFAEDGYLDGLIVGRHQGRDELRAFAEKSAQAIRWGARFRHVVTNLRIEVDGNQAKA